MSTIPIVALETTFLDWRLRTNDIISLVNINKVGTPDKIQTLRDIFNYIDSAGVISGCTITDNANGSIDVAAGEALLRLNNTEGSELFSIAIDAQPNVTLTDNDLNYVYVDYNTGTPIVSSVITSATINNNDVCLIAIISREGFNLTILEATSEITDQHNKLNNMLIDTEGFKHVIGGTQISESGTNTRKLSVLSGEFYRGLNKYTHSAYDTAVADNFEYYYRDGVGGWTETTATIISNVNYDDGTGTLATMTAGKYVVNWVFLKVGSNADELYVLYGQNEYDSVDDARIEVIPTILPEPLGELGIMIGRIIIKQASSSLNIVESSFGNQFRSTKSLIKDVTNGGTGVNTLSQYGVVVGNGDGPVHITTIGATGQVLTSNGAGQNPTYQEAIPNNSITLAKMADINTASFLGRNTVETGDPEVLSAATVRDILGVEAGATADQSAEEISAAAFSSGTLMLFQQTTAPTGWTKQTTHNNKTLRVVSGTVSSGGVTPFTTVFGSSKTTGGHAITEAQMPPHNHDTTCNNGGTLSFRDVGAGPNWVYQNNADSAVTSDNTGSGNTHNHTLSLDLQYVDLIIASKD